MCRKAETLKPGEEDLPLPSDGYVVSFVHFHERGFATPAYRFLRGLLHYYKIELQHLNPNGSCTWWRSLPYARNS